MGHIKDISNQSKVQTFPNSTFEIVGDVPAAQCSEAAIEGIYGATPGAAAFLIDAGAFLGWVLVGKVLTILAPPANIGDYGILGNTDDLLVLDAIPPLASFFNEYNVHDGGALILTRDHNSFFRFLQNYFISQQSNTGTVAIGLPTLTDAGKFPTDYTGFFVRVLNLAPPDTGLFQVLSNTPDVLTLNHTFAVNDAAVPYDVHIPTPQAATIKGGTLYTPAPENVVQKACSITFAPLT